MQMLSDASVDAELAGKTLAWLNREIWLELREKKRVCGPWKKGKAAQEDYKDSISLCTEKIRKTKGHLELHLASAVKDNKKCLYKYISHERRAKENLIFYWMQWHLETKHEEKTDVLNAFFAPNFNSKTSCCLGIQASEREELIIHLTINTKLPMRTNKSYPWGDSNISMLLHLAEGNPSPLQCLGCSTMRAAVPGLLAAPAIPPEEQLLQCLVQGMSVS